MMPFIFSTRKNGSLSLLPNKCHFRRMESLGFSLGFARVKGS